MSEAERARKKRGRPPIGEKVQVRLGEMLPQVDAWAEEHGVSRAEAVRRLVSAGLDAQRAPAA